MIGLGCSGGQRPDGAYVPATGIRERRLGKPFGIPGEKIVLEIQWILIELRHAEHMYHIPMPLSNPTIERRKPLQCTWSG
jgi:hypothetical protein